jgi:hypothetical protein
VRPLEGEAPRAVLGAEPPEVHVPDVEPRIALDDPVGHDPSHAAGSGDAVGAEAARHEEAADLRRLAEDELAVGGEGLGPVDQADDLRAADRRHPMDGALHQGREALPVRRQQLMVEVGRDPVESPRRRRALVAPGHQPPDLLAEIHEVIRVAEHRDRRVHPVDGLRHQVLMGHRDERDRDARHAADLRRVHPAGVHHDLGPDGPRGGLHLPDAAVADADPEHAGAGADRRPALPRAFRQRHGEAARVEVPVRREVDRAEDAVEAHHREQALRLGRADLLEGQAKRLRPALLPPVLEDAIGRAREAEAPGLPPARVPPGLGAEPPVALHAPHHQARQRDGGPELPHESRRVKRRSARQLGALDEHDVAPPLRGQVVRDARAAHAAADDDRPRVLGHGARL